MGLSRSMIFPTHQLSWSYSNYSRLKTFLSKSSNRILKKHASFNSFVRNLCITGYNLFHRWSLQIHSHFYQLFFFLLEQWTFFILIFWWFHWWYFGLRNNQVNSRWSAYFDVSKLMLILLVVFNHFQMVQGTDQIKILDCKNV